ncbi:MAG: prepilin-type N-terminal cleavage/methylation domain-containing protein, partial [Candidatus Marinimicrobia bacterium]|nr:prepilin-type N-terminal cleavage/methylation domain-containing protein [Candidatus Neomarinimicrobiota bacterium]
MKRNSGFSLVELMI